MPAQYATISAAYTAASSGDVICVAAGVYNFAYTTFVAGKAITIQGNQAGVDARTRDFEAATPPADETVLTHSGGSLFNVNNAQGVVIDGFYISQMSGRSLDSTGGTIDGLTLQNCIIKSPSTDTVSNQNGLVQFAGAGSVSGLTLRRNYIATSGRPFLYSLMAGSDWTISDNVINSRYFAFGPFAGTSGAVGPDGYPMPTSIVVERNLFRGEVAGVGSYAGFGFNGVLGDAVVRNNTFSGMRSGMGVVWLYGALVEGNVFDDNKFCALALRTSDSQPKPPSQDVIIRNNLIKYNGAAAAAGTASRADGLYIGRPSGGTSNVDASTITVTANYFWDLGLAAGNFGVRQSGDGTLVAQNNFWGDQLQLADVQARVGKADGDAGTGQANVEPFITVYLNDPAGGGLGFWPLPPTTPYTVFYVPKGYTAPTPVNSAVAIQCSTCSGTFTPGSPFTTPAEPTILDICYNDGNGVSPETCAFVPVYDPSAGFVTGGGW